MNDVSKYLGRGLLVLALSGTVFACGDDDDGPDDNDAGEAGSGGSRAGTGGGGTGGTDGGTDPVTPAECEMEAEEVNAPVSAACIECLCEEDADATAECDTDCWALIACVQLSCDGDADDTTCIVAECSDEVGGSGNLIAVGMLSEAVPFGDCTAECPVPSDGGTDDDAGN